MEARKFLRYVIPVAVFYGEAGFLLWILFPNWTEQQLARFAQADWASLVVGAAGSAGVGFLINTLHHWTNIHVPSWHPGVGYSRILRNLKELQVVELRCSRTGSVVPVDWPSDRKIESWSIVSGLWHERVGPEWPTGRANSRADSLANLVHSTGATSIAAFLALIALLIISITVGTWSTEPEPIARTVGAFALALLLVGLQEWSYQDTVKLVRAFLEQVLADTLKKEKAVTYVPIEAADLAAAAADKAAAPPPAP